MPKRSGTLSKMYSNLKNRNTKRNPTSASTSGYCQEIFVRQPAHLPCCVRKLAIGTSSVHERDLPQEKHMLRPPSPRPLLKRNITTFKKLPIIDPKMKNKSPKRVSIANSFYHTCHTDALNNTCAKQNPRQYGGGFVLERYYMQVAVASATNGGVLTVGELVAL
jgi:hypothetical protein